MISTELLINTSSAMAIVSSVNPSYIVTQIFNGLVLGIILVLVSLGLSIIFGIMGIVNFAHGEFLLIGAYVTWAATSLTGSFILGILAGTVGTIIIGMAIERITLRYTYDYDQGLQLLATFGIAELLRGSVQLVWGRLSKSLPVPTWGRGQIDFVLLDLPRYRVYVFVICIGVILAVYLFLNKTDTGLIIRAGTENREMVSALGINISTIFLIVFAFGAGLAGIAGGLVGPIRGVYPTLGVDFIILSFVVVVIGGIGSFRGTIVSGLLIGLLIVLTGVVYSAASEIIIFVAMALILIIRPRGLFGREGVLG
jgi:branched-chain amino acid transport system permease protein